MTFQAKTTILALALCAPLFAGAQTQGNTMKYELQPLPYAQNALEPYIDAETVMYHHDKHQAAYVANLNAAFEKAPEFKAPACLRELVSNLDKVPESIRTAVRNNGGGVWNHQFYWNGFTPKKTEPCEKLKKAIDKAFGSFDAFKEKMTAAGLGRFGSGWAWLVAGPDGELDIVSTPNQDAPLMGPAAQTCGRTPLLCIDVWEHAYYLKYKNLRGDYLKAVWNIVNWDEVCARYDKALAK